MSVARGITALRPRLLLPLCAAALAGSLVSGCTSSAEPSPLPPTPSSSSAAPSPSPTPPSLPPEAEGTSPKAAKAFVRHWVDTINYAMSTGDTQFAVPSWQMRIA